jgi:hypothetical protein
MFPDLKMKPYKCARLYAFNFLGYNALQSGESQLSFQRNILPPSSGEKSKHKRKAQSRHQTQVMKMRRYVTPKHKLTSPD